jgi:hypothetical protein
LNITFENYEAFHNEPVYGLPEIPTKAQGIHKLCEEHLLNLAI